MALWVIRILFLSLCTIGGYAVSQVRPEYVGTHYGASLGMVDRLRLRLADDRH